MRRVRVGVVGCGWFGNAHARVFREVSGADLLAVADINPSAARSLAEKYNVEAYTDIEKMIRKENLDAVSIAVTPQHLTETAVLAMESGAAVLLEKPLATNRQELSKLLSKVESTGSIFMPGFIELFNPAVRALKERIQKEELGEPLVLSSERIGRVPKRNLKWNIGVSLDLAIHELYVQMWLLEDRPQSRAYVSNKSSDRYEDLVVLLLNFKKGDASGIIVSNWLTPIGVRRMRFTGSYGSAVLDYLNQQLILDKHEGTFIPPVRRKEPLLEELQAFVDSVSAGRDPEINALFAKDVLETLFDGLENRL